MYVYFQESLNPSKMLIYICDLPITNTTDTHTHTHTHEYYSAIKKNEILPFAITWMDREGIKLSDMSQRKKNKYDFMDIKNLKKKNPKENKQASKQTNRNVSINRTN